MAGGSLGEQPTGGDTPCVYDRWFWDKKPLCKPKGYEPDFYEARKGFSGEISDAVGIDTGGAMKIVYVAVGLLVIWFALRAYEAYKR